MNLHSPCPCQLTAVTVRAEGHLVGKMVEAEASVVDHPQMAEWELSVWKTQPPPCSSPPLLLIPSQGPRPEAPPRMHAQAPAHGALHQRPMSENGDTPPARPYAQFNHAHAPSVSSCHSPWSLSVSRHIPAVYSKKILPSA